MPSICKLNSKQIAIAHSLMYTVHWTCWPFFFFLFFSFFFLFDVIAFLFIDCYNKIDQISFSLVDHKYCCVVFSVNISFASRATLDKDGRNEEFFLKGIRRLANLYDFDEPDSFDFLGFQRILDQLDENFDVTSTLKAVSDAFYVIVFYGVSECFPFFPPLIFMNVNGVKRIKSFMIKFLHVDVFFFGWEIHYKMGFKSVHVCRENV